MAHFDHEQESLMRPNWIATVVLVGALALCAIWLRAGLIGTEKWPIRWLDVEGELDRTSATQIRAAAASPASSGFFAVDLRAVREAVESLPWVAQAEVSRHWPDALRVAITEHRPVARWNDEGLFGNNGEVFRVGGSEGMQGLSRLSGPESRRLEVLEQWKSMRRQLNAIGMDIEALDLDERGAWEATLDSGVRLVLGRESVEMRLQRYIDVHEAIREQGGRPAVIDMRYTNGLAVRWAREDKGEEVNHG